MASLVLLSLFVCCSVIDIAAIGDPGVVGVFLPERQSDDSGGGACIACAPGVLPRNAALGLKALQLWHQFGFWLQFEHCNGMGMGGAEAVMGGGGDGACGDVAAAAAATARCCCCCC